MIRQTIEAVEPLDVLTPQQQALVVAATSGRLVKPLATVHPDLEIPRLATADLVVYRVVTDLAGDRESHLIVAPRDPRLQVGTDVTAHDSSVVWSESSDEDDGVDEAVISMSTRLIPFDWDTYSASP